MKCKLALTLTLPLALTLGGCFGSGSGGVPQPGDPTYRDAVSAFYASALAVQINDGNHKGSFSEKATKLAPGEPAVWANKALGELRGNEPDKADASLKEAEKLAPENAEIKVIRGLILEGQGKFGDAVKAFQDAAKANPKNVEAFHRIALAQIANVGFN